MRTGTWHHHGDHGLAKVGVRDADNGAFRHTFGLVQIALHLGRVDVVAARDDEVFAAPHDRQAPMGVEAADVAGAKPAVGGELLAGLLRHAPVAAEDVRSLHFDVAHFTARGHGPAGQCDTHLHTGQRKTDRAAATFAVFAAIGVGGEHQRFAHAIALENGVAGSLAELIESLDQQRRRAADEQAHAGAGLTREIGLGQQAHVQRGHAHEHAGVAHFPHRGGGVEPAEPQHLAAIEQSTMNGDKKAVHVEDGQRVHQHVAFTPAPVALQRDGVAEQVAVRQHGALAATRGAAGVEDRGEVVGLPGRRCMAIAVVCGTFQQTAAAIVVERENMFRAGLECDSRHPGEILVRTDHHARLGIADEIFDLTRLVGGVERQVDEAGAKHRQVQHQGLDRLLGLNRDPGTSRQV